MVEYGRPVRFGAVYSSPNDESLKWKCGKHQATSLISAGAPVLASLFPLGHILIFGFQTQVLSSVKFSLCSVAVEQRCAVCEVPAHLRSLLNDEGAIPPGAEQGGRVSTSLLETFGPLTGQI